MQIYRNWGEGGGGVNFLVNIRQGPEFPSRRDLNLRWDYLCADGGLFCAKRGGASAGSRRNTGLEGLGDKLFGTGKAVPMNSMSALGCYRKPRIPRKLIGNRAPA
jgi:hypothetical protein